MMEAIRGGQLPTPTFAVLSVMEPTAVAPGKVTFRTRPAEYQYNPMGTIYGGIIGTLCDTAMRCAVQTTLPAGSGEVVCEGAIIHLGGRNATVEAKVHDRQGVLYAHGTSTCLLRSPSNPTGEVAS